MPVYEGDTVDVNECDITGDSNVSEHVDVSTMTDELNHCACIVFASSYSIIGTFDF